MSILKAAVISTALLNNHVIDVLHCERGFSSIPTVLVLEANGMIRNIQHTLVADCGNVLAEQLGIVSDENVPYRATYILDPEGFIQHVSINALDTGRNADEILRTLRALKAGGLNGCQWEPGDSFVA